MIIRWDIVINECAYLNNEICVNINGIEQSGSIVTIIYVINNKETVGSEIQAAV